MVVSAIAMEGIEKSFEGVQILKGVDFDVRVGEVHALVGGNGAGKSTLMKILQGVHRPDGGSIAVDGEPVRFSGPSDAAAHGIGMVFQEFSLIPTLSVARNIFLGREPRRLGIADDRSLNLRAREVLARMDVRLDPTVPLSRLSVGYWQLTEIAKALSRNARVLIMDEPTASLPYHDAEQLFRLIERLKHDGVSIVYISHRMAEIARVADRITVLRDGRHVLTDDITAVAPDQVVEAIVGRQIKSGLTARRRSETADGPALLRAVDLQCGDRVAGVTFDLRPGEILGLAGLIGSGRTELARCLFGVDRRKSGQLLLRGQSLQIRCPSDAIKAGIMLVPEDRQIQGLVLDHTVRENLLLPSVNGLRRGPFVDDRRCSDLVGDLVQRLSIRGASLHRPIRRLSGGNQQKVVIAKWLGLNRTGRPLEVLILDEPTAGVDIATKTEIMELVTELADAGTGVILISSELEELLSVSDRVLVIKDGRVDSDLPRAGIADEESLQLAIQGV
jgi:ribose transport system ATP-binding protein